jgi:hypothetical protein
LLIIKFYEYVFSAAFLINGQPLDNSHSIKPFDDSNRPWNDPLFLAQFSAIPEPTNVSLIECIQTSFPEDSARRLIYLLEPGMLAVASISSQAKTDPPFRTHLLCHLLRLRATVQFIVVVSPQAESFLSYLCGVILPQPPDMHMLMLSFYFTSVFDFKTFGVGEATNLVRSFFGQATKCGNAPPMQQLFANLTAHTSAALAPSLLCVPGELFPNPILSVRDRPIATCRIDLLSFRFNGRTALMTRIVAPIPENSIIGTCHVRRYRSPLHFLRRKP